MQVIFEKRLTISEKERHWVIIPAKIRECFPACGIVFQIRIGNKTHSTYVDSYNRLRLGSRVFSELEPEGPNAIVVFEKVPEGYILRKKKDKHQFDNASV